MNDAKALAGQVRQVAYDLHVYLGHGHLVVGDYLADLLIEGTLIVELKTARALAPEHEAQVLGYLRGSRREHGLLINFGAYKFEIRKYVMGPANSSVYAQQTPDNRALHEQTP